MILIGVINDELEFKTQPHHEIIRRLFLLFVTIFSESFLTLMRSHFMSFSFFTAWHNAIFRVLKSSNKIFSQITGLQS